ncbi:MAG: response regulator [Dehalococcoidia bacterium]|nr:response regulator [Dehalococcoidia bacterium]
MNRKVLVVDDDPTMLKTVKAILSSNGFAVTTAAGGQQCLAELKMGFKGVILMDVMMPDMDGWATIREIVNRGLLEGNVITMLTAKHTPDTEMEELAECVLNYIRKPFELRELNSVVEECSSYLESLESI